MKILCSLQAMFDLYVWRWRVQSLKILGGGGAGAGEHLGSGLYLTQGQVVASETDQLSDDVNHLP